MLKAPLPVMTSRIVPFLKGRASNPVTRDLVHAALTELAPHLPGLALPVEPVPHVETLAQLLLLLPELLPDLLLLVSQLAVVGLELLRYAESEGRPGRAESATGDDRRHGGEERLGERLAWE